MSKVKSKNTKPELQVRSWLHKRGFRFRLHRKDLPGIPDIILPKYKTAIFVHGCFWHQHPGCKKATIPRTNHKFWKQKLERNVERDNEHDDQLKRQGWKVITVWECDVKKDIEQIMKLVECQILEQ
jgi:DNA mismatch endonuclease (patch repair protein)